MHSVAVFLPFFESIFPGKAELVSVFLIVNHSMAVGKGASLDILSCQADIIAFFQQGTEGKMFGRAKIDMLAGRHRFIPSVKDFLQLGMDGKSFFQL